MAISGTIYQTQLLTLAPGEIASIVGPVRYVTILSATDRDNVSVSFTGASFFPLPPGIALSFESSQVWIKNTDGSTNDILVASGAAELRDNRLIIDSLNPVSFALTGDATVVGKAAHDAVVAGAPMLNGAEARSSEGAAVGNGDAVRLMGDLAGRLVVAPYAPTDLAVRGSVQIAAVGVVDLVAAHATLRTHLTTIMIANEGAADNVGILLNGAAEVLRVAVKSGDTVAVPLPMPLPGTAATAWRFNIVNATSMRAFAAGYQGR